MSAALVLALAQQAHGLGAGGPQAASPVSQSLSGDGRFMVFTTSSQFSVFDSSSFNSDVYIRDLESGLTTLVSRPTGTTTPASGNAFSDTDGTVSADGRFVTFQSSATTLHPDDTDSTQDVFVRDVVAGTTTLVSRATGPSGVKANITSPRSKISADGRYVVFQSAATTLDPLDTDDQFDIYVRDLQTQTTTLVSRASGAGGAKGTSGSSVPSISADGSKVAFVSNAPNLDPADTNTMPDIFVRDLAANTTTLVSRTGTGSSPNALTFNSAISADGRHVAFTTTAVLHPDDSSTSRDIYRIDLQTGTTALVSRATGATGVKGNGEPTGAAAISADGRYVTFDSKSTNLDPDDTDSTPDVYVRDMQTDTTTLHSRLSGASGAKLANSSSTPALSADGARLAFVNAGTGIQDIYVRDLQTFETSLESRGTPGHARPKGATPLRVSLVPAYSPCAAPDRTHGPPLAFPSCSSPSQASAHLTIGTPDANGAAANSIGSVRLDALTGDFRIAASVTDVRCAAALPTCGTANTVAGPDYVGELRASFAVRQTDKFDSSGEAISTTLTDSAFGFTFGCAPTAAATGGSCTLSTTANAVAPGMIRNGDRTAMELGAITVHDGGPDGDADTADNAAFATQGIFVP